jgi:formylglycine-generating enzyme required for sulfatase activity
MPDQPITCPQCEDVNPAGSKFCDHCGFSLTSLPPKEGFGKTRLVDPNDLTVFTAGSLIANRYEVLRELGRGGMGAVYLVADEKLAREEMALKIISPALVNSPEIQRRFVQEVIASQKLFHENIIRVHHLDETRGLQFFTMEFLPGKSLREVMVERFNQGKVFDLAEAVAVLSPVLSALTHAHSKNVIHRDLKPENIILDGDFSDPDISVKVLDFGLARIMSPSRMTSSAVALGTAYYMSPEQLAGKGDVDHRTDLFAAGVIFYELLTGKIPTGRFKLPSQLNPELPKAIDDIVDQALASEPDERFQDSGGFQEAIAQLTHAETAAQIKERQRREAEEHQRREAEEKERKAAEERERERQAAVEREKARKESEARSRKEAEERERRQAEEREAARERERRKREAEEQEKQARAAREEEARRRQAEQEAVARQEAAARFRRRRNTLAVVISVALAVMLIGYLALDRRETRVGTGPVSTGIAEAERPAARPSPPPSTPAPRVETPSRPATPVQPPTPARYSLTVRPTPSDATVRILNITPRYFPGISLEPDDYHIEVSQEGYETHTQTVALKNADLVMPITLTRIAAGSIAVSGSPSGAEVFLDGRKVGSLPTTLRDLRPGTYTVSVKQSGYEAYEARTTVSAGQNRELSVSLPPVRAAGPAPEITNSFGMKFVYISPGTFWMGSPSDEPGRDSDEGPRHQVTLTKGYYLQTTEVTVGQWRAFIRDTGYRTEAETGGGAWVWTGSTWEKKAGYYWDKPGFSQTDSHPLTCVSWNDVQKFMEWLSRKEGHRYRLPTEAEWEYAARAGSATAFANGPIRETGCGHDPNLAVMGWYCGNAGNKTHPVAQKQPNAWGLYDMHGNVWEWCADWFGNYPSSAVTDPTGPSSGSFRVYRGGSWGNGAQYCRSANRGNGSPVSRSGNLGFRLARTP